MRIEVIDLLSLILFGVDNVDASMKLYDLSCFLITYTYQWFIAAAWVCC